MDARPVFLFRGPSFTRGAATRARAGACEMRCGVSHAWICRGRVTNLGQEFDRRDFRNDHRRRVASADRSTDRCPNLVDGRRDPRHRRRDLVDPWSRWTRGRGPTPLLLTLRSTARAARRWRRRQRTARRACGSAFTACENCRDDVNDQPAPNAATVPGEGLEPSRPEGPAGLSRDLGVHDAR
jgi:hypothetical protein